MANDVFNTKNCVIPASNNLKENYLQVITELLSFIENHFTRYFNLDEKIPDSYKFIMPAKCKVYVKAIHKMAVSVVLCETIIEIVLIAFNDFVKAAANKTYTYRQVIYLKKLNNEMMDCLQLPSENYT